MVNILCNTEPVRRSTLDRSIASLSLTRYYGHYLRDLPGSVAVAETLEELKKLIAEAIAFHIEGLKEEDLPISKPTRQWEYVEA